MALAPTTVAAIAQKFQTLQFTLIMCICMYVWQSMGVNPPLAIVAIDYFVEREMNIYFKSLMVMNGAEAMDYNVMYFKGLMTSV